MTIEGTLLSVSRIIDGTSKTGNPYQQQFILIGIDEQSQYPQTIKVDLGKKHIGTNIGNVGQSISVEVNLRGNAYTDKSGEKNSFTALQLWKVNSSAQNQPAQQQMTGYGNGGNQQSFGGYNNAPQQQNNGPQITSGTDDLPF